MRVLSVLLFLSFAAGCGRDRPDPLGDAGTADAAGPSRDGGPSADAPVAPADGGPMCVPEILMPYDGRPCPTSIRECAEACTDSSCADACMEMGTGECAFCMDLNIIACVNRNGCQERWNCYRECVRTECGATPTGACIDENCLDLENEFNDCITDEILEACGTRYLDCVPE